MANNDPRFKKGLQIEDEITVTMPFFRWFAFVTSYMQSEWNNTEAGLICNQVQRMYLDQVYIREWEAAVQEAHDKMHAQAASFPGILGIFQDPPPEDDKDPRLDIPPEPREEDL